MPQSKVQCVVTFAKKRANPDKIQGNNPKPFVQIGSTSGQAGVVELSDFVVATQGPTPGAILIEYNLASNGEPAAMWDVHTRIGGFTGSNLQLAQCAVQPGSSAVDPNCITAYMSMHVTSQSSGLYMENCWLWTADHDIDDEVSNRRVTLFSGRGICKLFLVVVLTPE